MSWPAPVWQKWYRRESLLSALASFKSHLNPFLILALLNVRTALWSGFGKWVSVGASGTLAGGGSCVADILPAAAAPSFWRLECLTEMALFASTYAAVRLIERIWRIKCQDTQTSHKWCVKEAIGLDFQGAEWHSAAVPHLLAATITFPSLGSQRMSSPLIRRHLLLLDKYTVT